MLVQYDDIENILKTSKVFEAFLPAAAEDRQLGTHRAASPTGLSAVLNTQAELWEADEF